MSAALPLPQAAMLPALHIAAGDVHCTIDPTLLVTVLGSCVSVCLWDAVLRQGGMNHFALPHERRTVRSARCGDVAVPELIAGVRALGSRIQDLRAKVFGGAAVLNFGRDGESIGEEYVRIALSALQRENIPVVARLTGGNQGMAIRFDPRNGGVLVRRLAAGNLLAT